MPLYLLSGQYVITLRCLAACSSSSGQDYDMINGSPETMTDYERLTPYDKQDRRGGRSRAVGGNNGNADGDAAAT